MKKISLTRLIVLTYCMVAGGPVGLEEIIKPVGYIPASLIVFFVPLLWSLPIALLVGHLAGAFPKVEGGFYGWSKLVLGPHLAFLHAWVVLAATIFDMAMYPSLFTVYLAYFLPQVGVSKTWAVIAGMGLIAEGVVVNLFGLKNVGKSSFVSSVLSYAPFGLLIVVVLWCGPLASTAVPGVVLAQAKPITFDQFSWAHYVSKLRVGLRAPQLRRMSPERLAKLIAEAIGDSALRARADALGTCEIILDVNNEQRRARRLSRQQRVHHRRQPELLAV